MACLLEARRGRNPAARLPIGMFLVFVLGCLLFATSSQHVHAAVPPVIKVGAVLPLTGPLAGAGYRAWMLLNQSLAELPTNLPSVLKPLGTHLELVVADSSGTQRGSSRATLALAQQGVSIVLGGVEALNLASATDTSAASAINPTGATGVGAGFGSSDLALQIWTANSLPIPLAVLALSSSACGSRIFDSVQNFPALFRMCTRQTAKTAAMLDTFRAFGWKKMAILAQDGNDGYGENSAAASDPIGDTLAPGQSEADYLVYSLGQLTSAAEASANILRLRLPAVTALAKAQLESRLIELRDSGFRIVVLYLQGDLLLQAMRLAHSMDMLRHPYVWIGAGANSGPASTYGMGSGSVRSGGQGPGLCTKAMKQGLADLTPSVPSIDSSAGELISTYQSSSIGASTSSATYVYQADLAFSSNPLLGTMCFTPSAPRTPAFTNLRYRLQAQGLSTESVISGDDANTYDSILVVASAFDRLLRDGTPTVAGTTALWSIDDITMAITSVNIPTAGLNQDLRFSPIGDRYGSVDIFNYDPYGSASGGFVRRAVWRENDSGDSSLTTGNLTIADAFLWSDGSTVLPPDHVDAFAEGQVIVPTKDARIQVLAFFFVLLPAFVLIYNARLMIKSFVDAYTSSTAIAMAGLGVNNANGAGDAEAEGAGIDKEWIIHGLRAGGLFALSGVLAMVYLNFLALSFPTGLPDLAFDQGEFIGNLFLLFAGACLIVPAPLLLETWWAIRGVVRSGGQDTAAVAKANDLAEDFELHMADGEDQSATSPAAQAAQDKAKDKADKEKNVEDAQKAPISAKAKARAARKKARAGALTRDDTTNFVESELQTIWDKTTVGSALTSLLFATLVTGVFLVALDGLRMPLHMEFNGGKLFGVWLLQAVCLHACTTWMFKDSRNLARVFAACALTATLMMTFHANLSAVTFTYSNLAAERLATDTAPRIEIGGIAIAHAILFAIPFFVGLLQLIRALKLSRHSLDAVLSGMKAKLTSLEAGLEASKADRKAAAGDADHLKRLLELANLCRPLHRNHALAFAMAETTGQSGGVAGADATAKAFVPASFVQEQRAGGGKDTAASVNLVGRANSVGQRDSPNLANRALSIKLPAGPSQTAVGTPQMSPTGPDASPVGMSSIRASVDGPASPSFGGAMQQRSKGIVGSPVAGSNNSQGMALSQGIDRNAANTASQLTGLDFGFLARPKAELTGYKLLNELSLELFLASGPVHHRAVADIHLAHILAHPLTLELFKDSLTRTGAQETLAFWMDIQRYKQIDDDVLRRQIAEAMVATFLYSDAPYPIHFLTPASREQLLNIIFAKKGLKPTSFHFIEQELVAAMQKDFGNFATTTGFKVCAFLLGHSSYRPSTRIKTLNPGGAAVGDGGALVPMTQNHGPMSHFVTGAGGELSASGPAGGAAGGAQDDPQSMTQASGLFAAGAGATSKNPAAPGRSAVGTRASAGGTHLSGPAASPKGSSPQALLRRTTVDTGLTGGKKSPGLGVSAGASDKQPISPNAALASPSGAGAGGNLDQDIQPQLIRFAELDEQDEVLNLPSAEGGPAAAASDDKEDSKSSNADDADDEKKPLSPSANQRRV